MLIPALVLAVAAAAAEPAVVLGRCPFEKTVAVVAGRFTNADTDDILIVQDLGRMELSRGPGHDKAVVDLRRLALLRPSGASFKSVWQSEPFNSTSAQASDIAGTCWTSGDVNADGLSELLMFNADTCKVFSFGGTVPRDFPAEIRGLSPRPDSLEPDTVTTSAYGLNGAWVEAATCCDPDGDSLTEVATIELSQVDSGFTTRLLRLYRMADSGIVPCGAYSAGVNWGADTRLALLGSARLDDYPGELAVVAGIYATLKPSEYGILYRPAPDSLVLTTNPFPWQEWFSKERVLPAGELSLFNVGDTLVAYGYFVPGARPSGPSQSFAALDDGEWRLLPLLEDAKRISGPICRFTWNGTAGWVELRDNLFYFYPGEIFRWR
jgi:hypothetical protein